MRTYIHRKIIKQAASKIYEPARRALDVSEEIDCVRT
jgi:hypothetical protein